jgi:tRNA(fMet)-specific endonuclease VapC
MIYRMDTDSCVYWLRGHDAVRARLVAIGVDNVAVSVVALAELRCGALSLSGGQSQDH